MVFRLSDIIGTTLVLHFDRQDTNGRHHRNKGQKVKVRGSFTIAKGKKRSSISAIQSGQMVFMGPKLLSIFSEASFRLPPFPSKVATAQR